MDRLNDVGNIVGTVPYMSVLLQAYEVTINNVFLHKVSIIILQTKIQQHRGAADLREQKPKESIAYIILQPEASRRKQDSCQSQNDRDTWEDCIHVQAFNCPVEG